MNHLRAVLCIACYSLGWDFAIAAELEGTWYLRTFRQDGTTIMANAERNEELRVARDGQGGLVITNARPSMTLSVAEYTRTGDAVFYYAGLAATPQRYRMTLRDDTLEIRYDAEQLEFGRTRPPLPAPAPVVAARDHITITEPWVRQHWFKGFDRDFERVHGRTFEACYSDERCLRECDATGVCRYRLHELVLAVIVADNERDPLFADHEASSFLSRLARFRGEMLDLRDQMDRKKAASLLATKDVTLDLFTKLIEDGSPAFTTPAKDDPYFTQALEVVGCTAGGYLPGIGNLVALGCGIHGLSTLSPANIAASKTGDSDLAHLFTKLRATQDDYHLRTYDAWDEEIAGVLKTAGDADLVETLAGQLKGQFDGVQQPTAEAIVDSIFDAVWPYAFFLLAEGREIGLQPNDPNTCQLLFNLPSATNPVGTLLRSFTNTPAYWGLSLHYALDGSSFFYKRLPTDRATLFAWTLNIGSVADYKPIGRSAMAMFRGYLARRQVSVLGRLWDADRVLVKTPYGVRQNIQPKINHVNDNFVEYEPENPGFMVWPPATRQIEALDSVGLIRQSVHGRSGRLALPPVRCMIAG